MWVLELKAFVRATSSFNFGVTSPSLTQLIFQQLLEAHRLQKKRLLEPWLCSPAPTQLCQGVEHLMGLLHLCPFFLCGNTAGEKQCSTLGRLWVPSPLQPSGEFLCGLRCRWFASCHHHPLFNPGGLCPQKRPLA